MAKLREGQYKKVLFLPTGALLSTTSTQQGDTIPCVCHAIVIEANDELNKKQESAERKGSAQESKKKVVKGQTSRKRLK